VGDLGYRQVFGEISNDDTNPYGNGFYCARFTPQILAFGYNEFEVYHISLRGPSGSTLDLYVNTTFYDTTPRGDINSWDGNNPIHMFGGQTLNFYWSAGGTTPPQVTVWCRTLS
jgi:hypothetical protein